MWVIWYSYVFIKLTSQVAKTWMFMTPPEPWTLHMSEACHPAWRQPLPFWHRTMLPRRWHRRTLLLRGYSCFSPLDTTSWHVIQLYYTRIYIQGPCFDHFYSQSQGKLSFLKAGVYLESKSKTMKSWWDIRICSLHCTTIYRTIILMRTSYSISGSLFSCASALSQDVLLHIGLIRIEPICRLLRQQCKFVAWICLGQIVGGQNRLNLPV